MTTTYDPFHPAYLDEADLRQEMDRVFALCHGSRLCFKFCTSIPTLFEMVDTFDDQDAGRMTPVQQDQVVDECFGCKFCYINCPYVPLRPPAVQHLVQEAARGRVDRAARDRVTLFPAGLVEYQAADVGKALTCGYIPEQDYLATDDARLMAEHTRDACEHLMAVHQQGGGLDTDFTGETPETITYHAPCHLRAQHVGLKSRDLLELTGAEVVAGDCHLANGGIVQETGRSPVHPLQVPAAAYEIPEEDRSWPAP